MCGWHIGKPKEMLYSDPGWVILTICRPKKYNGREELQNQTEEGCHIEMVLLSGAVSRSNRHHDLTLLHPSNLLSKALHWLNPIRGQRVREHCCLCKVRLLGQKTGWSTMKSRPGETNRSYSPQSTQLALSFLCFLSSGWKACVFNLGNTWNPIRYHIIVDVSVAKISTPVLFLQGGREIEKRKTLNDIGQYDYTLCFWIWSWVEIGNHNCLLQIIAYLQFPWPVPCNWYFFTW